MAAPQILLVEEDPADTKRICDALQEDGPPIQLEVLPSSHDAVQYLRSLSPSDGAARPSLILLSMQPPHLSNSAVLTVLQNNPLLRQIPVVVLTRSRAISDMLHSYDLYANSCVLKPAEDAAFRRAIRAIRRFWIDLAVLPSHEGHR